MAVGGVVRGNTACPNYSDLVGIKGGYLDEAAGASVPWQGHAVFLFIFFFPTGL